MRRALMPELSSRVVQPFNLDELLNRLAAEFEAQTLAAQLMFEVRPATVAVSERSGAA